MSPAHDRAAQLRRRRSKLPELGYSIRSPRPGEWVALKNGLSVGGVYTSAADAWERCDNHSRGIR